jgi:hypothetical protein
MPGTFDYCPGKSIEADQIVPDEARKTIDAPDLSNPWSPTHTTGWRWLNEEWMYLVPKGSVALTNLNALGGARVCGQRNRSWRLTPSESSLFWFAFWLFRVFFRTGPTGILEEFEYASAG